MPELYGRTFTRQQISKYTGSISQVGGIKRYELADGRSKGVEVLEFRTGGGLMFRVLPGRGMDISLAEFMGAPLAWISPCGEAAPEHFDPEGDGWLRSFFGGLLTTCGLRQIGHPSVDGDEELGLHGRISNIRAENVCCGGEWSGDDYIMTASGRVVEARVFGEHITLTRRVSAKLGSAELSIHDTVENEGCRPEPHMMLYHVNIGFPVLDEGSEMVSSSELVTPWGAEAEAEKDLSRVFSAPAPGYKERLYYHDIRPAADGTATVAIVNKNFASGRGLGVSVKYNKEELPHFLEWKMNGEGVYAVGLEPANAKGYGRAVEREEGRLQVLEPGEKREYHLEIKVLKSVPEINALENDIKEIPA